MLRLGSEDDGACASVSLVPGVLNDPLLCEGDITDACCRKNPAFPRLNAPVVAVGRYRGASAPSADGTRNHFIDLDSYCLPPPAPAHP